MGFLLFDPAPRHIGMIGLGGGSMQKYCYRHLPNSRISVAEISPEVIALRDRFCIPNDDHRFTVSCEDGADFVKRHQGEFDVLIVDGFDIGGQPPELCSPDFYNDCWTALTPEGILAVNVCEARDSILISRMKRIFRQGVLVVGGDTGANTVAFAAKGGALGHTRQEFMANGRKIELAAASL
jgi:spermidine synthase